MKDDAVPQSLFVVVSWDSMAPCSISILQLETKKHNLKYAANSADSTEKPRPPARRRRPSFTSLETQLNQKEYVAHFNQRQVSSTPTWMFSPLKSSTCIEELCMLPFWCPKEHETDVPLRGCVFNLRTKMCRPMPFTGIRIGHVVTLGGAIYVIARPYGLRDSFERFDLPFQRYDPARGFWETLNPFPSDAAHELGPHAAHVFATAVWKDTTILFNMGGRKICAYEVERDKWFTVKVQDNWWCCSIEGEAVVLEDTIYALTTRSFHLVLALSIQREDSNSDIVCSLRWKISVPDIDPISFMGAERRTRHLAYLGKDNFCLVQSCKLDESSGSYYNQPIQLTNIRRNEEDSECSMTVVDECTHQLRVPDFEPFSVQFRVEFCFSLPECKTTAFKGRQRFLFNLDPFPADFDPKQKLKTDSDTEPEEEFEALPMNFLSTSELLAESNDTSKAVNIFGNGALSDTVYTDAYGRSVYVRNLLPDATFGQFEKEMKKFRPCTGFEIQFIRDDTVSAIITEGCRAEMEENRRIIDKVSAVITVGYRAEMEEDRRINDKVSAVITEGYRAEMEEDRRIIDKMSAVITEAYRAEMEEDRRIIDKVSALITEGYRAEMEEDRRINDKSCQVSALITAGYRAETEEDRRINDKKTQGS